jgi:hypothetical protein
MVRDTSSVLSSPDDSIIKCMDDLQGKLAGRGSHGDGEPRDQSYWYLFHIVLHLLMYFQVLRVPGFAGFTKRGLQIRKTLMRIPPNLV